MKGFTDIHSHFVYGIDDGARTGKEMEAMLDAAYADGIASLISTPHVTPGMEPFDRAVYERHLQAARAYCESRGYDMALHPGAEILYTPALVNHVSSHRLPTLADTNMVLMEFVPDIALSEIEEALELMERYGYGVIVAHVERYACLFKGRALKNIRNDFDVQCQMNCRTILGKNGLWRGHCIQKWLTEGMIDRIASDAHNTTTRPFGMSQAHRVLCGMVGREAADFMAGVIED